MKWYWEHRSDTEYTPPNLSTILAGWEEPKAGLFSKMPVPDQTEIFVRELVQNFVDASREMYAPGTKPKLTFRFVRLRGVEVERVRKGLGLDGISEHYGALTEETKSQLRLARNNLAEGVTTELSLLVVTETGTSGMYGQWKRSDETEDSQGREIKNKMRDALISNVRDATSAGKGLGSYGEGKKAVIGISIPRTILTYTCFLPESSQDGVYSRFLGSLYWENHIKDKKKFSGLALLGQEAADGSRPEPFTDAKADAIVEALSLPGLEVRKNNQGLETGTTMVFFEPAATAPDIAVSIARNWWPLIIDDGAEFEVFDEDGKKLEVKIPDELEPFVLAFKAKETVDITDWDGATGPSYLCKTLKSSADKNAARLSLGIDLRPGVGFSHANPDTNWSLVALIRDGMLISYQHFPRSTKDHIPFVRGIVEVSSSENKLSEKLLRKIEPPLHNSWSENKGTGIDSETRRHAKEIMDAIKDSVFDFKKSHEKILPEIEQDLPIFRELLGIKGGAFVDPVPPVPNVKSIFSMLNDQAKVVEGTREGYRYASATRSVSITPKAKVSSAKVVITLGWEIEEDGTWVEASNDLALEVIEFPDSLAAFEGSRSFSGTLAQTPVSFAWRTREYRELWTLRPYMKIERLDGGQDVQ
jgi:hypothetical protein